MDDKEQVIQSIGKYQVLSVLGRGSMGVVYKAQDPEIGRVVAIKTLRTMYIGDDSVGQEALQRFRQESRSAGRLQHPNIVTIFEAGRTDNGTPFIVMELIDGQSLEVIVSQRPLDPLEALHYLGQTASAIDYAHSQDVIHRDIKPSNIIIDTHFRPHLLDFGVAKLSDTSLTPAGTVVGTPSYMSPEQIRGETLDGLSDLFAFAVVAYELFTGARPFPGADFTTVVGNIINKDPLSFESLGCALPREAEQVLFKGLSKDRSSRYPSALELVDALAKPFDVLVDGSGLVGGYTLRTSWKGIAGENSTAAAASSTASSLELSGGAPSADQSTKVEAEESATMPAEERNLAPYFFLAAMLLIIAGVISFLFGGNIGFGTGKRQTQTQTAQVAKTGQQPAKTTARNAGKTPPSTEPTTTIPAVPPIDEASRAAALKGLSELATDEPVKAVTLTPPVQPPVISSKEELTTLDNVQLAQFIGQGNSSVLLLDMALEEAAKRADIAFVAPIASLVRHPEYKIRISVAKVLSRPPFNKEPAAFGALVALLSDAGDPLVRSFAAKNLSAFPAQSAVPALEARNLIETDSMTQKMIRDSLAKLKAS